MIQEFNYTVKTCKQMRHQRNTLQVQGRHIRTIHFTAVHMYILKCKTSKIFTKGQR